MCSHFPNTFSRGTVQKFRGTLVCRGTPFENPCSRQSAHEACKVVSPTHRPPLPPGNITGTHFCWRLSQPHGLSGARRIMSTINSYDNIGNQTSDLPTCSAVPQPNAPPRALQWPLHSKLKFPLQWTRHKSCVVKIKIHMWIKTEQ